MSDWWLLGTMTVFAIAMAACYAGATLRVRPWWLLLLASAVLVPPMYSSRNGLEGFPNVDIGNFQRTGELVRAGTYVYAQPQGFIPFHPYLPFQMFIAAAASWIADVSSITFSIVLKAPNVAAAIATALLLLSAARRLHEPRIAWFAPVAFLLNPSLVETTAYHGQFDALPALLAFAAWFVLRFSADGRSVMLSAALLGLAILAKTWPVALLPLLLLHTPGGLRQRAAYAATALAIPAIATASYVLALSGSFDDVWRTVGEYRGVTGLSGYSMILDRLPGSDADVHARFVWVQDHGRTVFYAGLATTLGIVVAARPKLEEAMLIVLVAVYVFAPAATPSYFVWLLPFALIAKERLFPALYSVTAVTARCSIICYDHFWQWTPQWFVDRSWYLGAAAWGIMALWLIWLLGGLARTAWTERVAAPDEGRRDASALMREPA